MQIEIVTDPITGLLVLSAGENALVLTSEEVEELLVDFPLKDYVSQKPTLDRLASSGKPQPIPLI